MWLWHRSTHVTTCVNISLHVRLLTCSVAELASVTMAMNDNERSCEMQIPHFVWSYLWPFCCFTASCSQWHFCCICSMCVSFLGFTSDVIRLFYSGLWTSGVWWSSFWRIVVQSSWWCGNPVFPNLFDVAVPLTSLFISHATPWGKHLFFLNWFTF